MSLYDTSTKLTCDGKPMACRCGAVTFKVRHIHNPYGHDMCENVARCEACGNEYSYYVGHLKPLLDSAPEVKCP